MSRAPLPAPVVIATLGIPGCGKTHFAHQLCRETGFFHLNSDRVRSEVSPSPTKSAEETAVVFRVMDFVADEILLRGGGVVYDALFSRKAYRDRLRNMAERHEALYLLLWFQVPLEIAVERAANRTDAAGDRAVYYPRTSRADIETIAASIEEPSREPFAIIDGLAPYEDQRSALVHALDLAMRSSPNRA